MKTYTEGTTIVREFTDNEMYATCYHDGLIDAGMNHADAITKVREEYPGLTEEFYAQLEE
jgi:hypothetical protein